MSAASFRLAPTDRDPRPDFGMFRTGTGICATRAAAEDDPIDSVDAG